VTKIKKEIIIILSLILVLSGCQYIKTGSGVPLDGDCISNEPNFNDIPFTDFRTIISTELAGKNVIGSDCDFISIQLDGSVKTVGKNCVYQVTSEIQDYQNDICYGKKSKTDPLCFELYMLGAITEDYTGDSNIQEIRDAINSGLLTKTAYKGIDYYYIVPEFNELNEFTIDDYAINAFLFSNDESYLISGSFFNNINTIERYIETFYTCQEYQCWTIQNNQCIEHNDFVTCMAELPCPPLCPTLEECQNNLIKECQPSETREYTCPDGTKVNWCVCEDNKWSCVTTPSDQCEVICTPSWQCPNWQNVACVNKLKTRVCKDLNNCQSDKTEYITCEEEKTFFQQYGLYLLAGLIIAVIIYFSTKKK